MIAAVLVNVTCPRDGRFLVALPKGTPYRGYCLGCGLKWEAQA